jgi:uncharacterized YccA/Bax inhibitor family protein
MADRDYTSRNPVLNREFNDPARYATFGTQAADAATLQQQHQLPATAAGDARMTVQDVVVKTAILFVILVPMAVVGWNTGPDYPFLVWGAMLVGLGLGFANALKRSVSPALVMLYALVEGIFLGGISRFYNQIAGTESTTINDAGQVVTGDNIVGQAVLGTLVAFGVMLALYASGKLRATPRFQKMMMIAMVSYLGIAVVSLISSFFGVGEGWGFYGVGGLGILLCVAGVGLASFSLVLDFDAIEKGTAYGLPERESWRASFGLLVTLIWLYLELLRLLAILQRN